MALALNDKALAEALGPTEGAGLWAKRVALVVLGIAALAIAAKIKVPMWPSPVPITLGTFAVLTIGAAYGPWLGLTTILGYLAIGVLGFDVFASSQAHFDVAPLTGLYFFDYLWAALLNYDLSMVSKGVEYVLGGSGGYLLGYALAIGYLGVASRRGLDRSIEGMGGAMLVSNLLIYVPGLLWLHQWIVAGDRFNAEKFSGIWDQTLAWGLTPYVMGDLMKLALAALLVPAVWALVGKARG